MPKPFYYGTYGDIVREPVEQKAVDDFCRQRMEAAVSILRRMIAADFEGELDREMERKRKLRARRKHNLMMAGVAMEKIRSLNEHMREQDFTDISRTRVYQTLYGLQMKSIEKLLQDFWTGETE